MRIEKQGMLESVPESLEDGRMCRWKKAWMAGRTDGLAGKYLDRTVEQVLWQRKVPRLIQSQL